MLSSMEYENGGLTDFAEIRTVSRKSEIKGGGSEMLDFKTIRAEIKAVRLIWV